MSSEVATLRQQGKGILVCHAPATFAQAWRNAFGDTYPIDADRRDRSCLVTGGKRYKHVEQVLRTLGHAYAWADDYRPSWRPLGSGGGGGGGGGGDGGAAASASEREEPTEPVTEEKEAKKKKKKTTTNKGQKKTRRTETSSATTEEEEEEEEAREEKKNKKRKTPGSTKAPSAARDPEELVSGVAKPALVRWARDHQYQFGEPGRRQLVYDDPTQIAAIKVADMRQRVAAYLARNPDAIPSFVEWVDRLAARKKKGTGRSRGRSGRGDGNGGQKGDEGPGEAGEAVHGQLVAAERARPQADQEALRGASGA